MEIFRLQNYPLTIKMLILFFILTILLIFIRTILAQPKIKERNVKDDIYFISNSLLMNKDLLNNLPINKAFEKQIKINIKNSLQNNLKYESASIELFYSNSENGNLSSKEEIISNKTIISWTLKLLSFDENKNLFLKYSIDKKELDDKNSVDILILFLLPETLIAITISIILLLLIFSKMLNNIDDLTKTIFKSLEEKEILLKEIHHRVKNNLALTIGLIELQEEEINDEKAKKVLIDIKERIYTMELVHRKLYESSNLNNISFKDYVVDLTKMIAKTYNRNEEIIIDIKMEEIELNIETAIPYGLILNELITNSFKYAFTENLNPKLEISLLKENEKIILILKDNGKGLDKDFEKISTKTLGLKLINMIVKHQLQGNISYNNVNGAKFTIEGKIINSN